MEELFTYNQKLTYVFKEFSFEIFQFLKERDIYTLRLGNKVIFDIVECHLLFKNSIKELDGLFSKTITIPNEKEQPKSKFLSKFDFKNIMTEIKNTEMKKPSKKKKSVKEDPLQFNNTHAGFFTKKDNLFTSTSADFNKKSKVDAKKDDIVIRKTTAKEKAGFMNSTNMNFNKKNKKMLNFIDKNNIDEENSESD